MPNEDQSSIDGMILRLHAASLVPELWPAVMNELSALFGGRPMMYGVQWFPAGISFMNTVGLPAEAVAVLVNQFSNVETNPVAQALGPSVQPHEPIKIYSVIDRESLHSTEYYQRTIKQMGGVIGDLVVVPSLTPTRFTAAVLMRRFDEQPAGDVEMDLLRRLSPHMGHAMEVMVRLGRLTASQSAMSRILCQVAQPVALLDADKQLVFANPVFEDMLNNSEVVGIERGRLVCRVSTQRNDFERFMDRLTASGDEIPSDRAITLLSDASGARVTLIGQHVSGEFADDLELGQTRAILFASTAGALRDDLVGLMVERFRLSRQQALVLRHVIDGLDGPSIAERLSISQNTLKTHMNRIYEKTFTTNREELFRSLIALSTQSPLQSSNGGQA